MFRSFRLMFLQWVVLKKRNKLYKYVFIKLFYSSSYVKGDLMLKRLFQFIIVYLFQQFSIQAHYDFHL